MFKNYLKIGLRNLVKKKIFSLINIIGLAGAALILLCIINELSFDRFHDKKDKTYEVSRQSLFDGKNVTRILTSKSMAYAAMASYPKIGKTAQTFAFLFSINKEHLNTNLKKVCHCRLYKKTANILKSGYLLNIL
jgi:putative ABC transport system permease protein